RRTGPFKRAVVAVWMLWEKLFHLMFRVRPIGSGEFMHYRVIRYSGPELRLQGGRRLRRGDRLMEMHFDNEKMYEIGMESKSPVHIAIRIIREAEKVLPDVAREFATLPDHDGIWGIYGISMINRGGESLGFETSSLPKGLFSVSTNWYLRLLLRIIHPEGNRKIRNHGEKLEPRVIVMPKETLLLWGDAKSSAEARRLIKQRESVAAAADRQEISVYEEDDAASEEAAPGAVT
ncbi:YkoP family protein, partial [Cohnella zeiphila]|nr:polysaccharide deacetylase family protein [Cohnella zeiphila]